MACFWVWTENKNRTNKLNQGLSFETAQLVSDDPLPSAARIRTLTVIDGKRWA